MQVSEVMHQGVHNVQSSDSLKHVAQLMKEKDIGSLPVFEQNTPVGFVTDRDIVISCVAKGASSDEPISKAMTKNLIVIYEDNDLSEAAELMKDNQVSRLLVLNEREKPTGILTLQDLTNATGKDKLKADVITEIKKE